MKLSKGNHEQFSDVQPISRLRVIHKWRPHAYVARPFINWENVPVREESGEDQEIDPRVGVNIWFDGRIDSDSETKSPGTPERDAFSPAATFLSMLKSFVEAKTELLFIHEGIIPQKPSFRGIGNRTFLCEPIGICILKGIANIDLMESEYEQLSN